MPPAIMQTTKPSPDVFALKPKDSAFDNSDKSSFFLNTEAKIITTI